MASGAEEVAVAGVKVLATCPGCGGHFAGQEQGVLMQAPSGIAALSHPWCVGEARRRGWRAGVIAS